MSHTYIFSLFFGVINIVFSLNYSNRVITFILNSAHVSF